MNNDYHISSTGSHAMSAVVALVATALLLWLVFTVAGDYFAADEQTAQASAQQATQHAAAPAPGAAHAH